MSLSWSVHAVGEVAGKVWKFLRDNGASSLTAVEKGVDAPASMVDMALGWLAREGKIAIDQDRRTLVISLVNP